MRIRNDSFCESSGQTKLSPRIFFHLFVVGRNSIFRFRFENSQCSDSFDNYFHRLKCLFWTHQKENLFPQKNSIRSQKLLHEDMRFCEVSVNLCHKEFLPVNCMVMSLKLRQSTENQLDQRQSKKTCINLSINSTVGMKWK